MFGLGFTEIIVILVIALIFLGPERLPEVARTLGKTLGELRRTADELRFDLTTSDYSPPKNLTSQNLTAGDLRTSGSDTTETEKTTLSDPVLESREDPDTTSQSVKSSAEGDK